MDQPPEPTPPEPTPPEPTPPVPTPPVHPLIGAGLHMLDGEGLVKRQAEVVAIIPSGNANVGDLALIQYFDWSTGAPAIRALFPLHELTGETWVLYRSVDEMKDHYQRIDAPRAAEAERKKAEEKKD